MVEIYRKSDWDAFLKVTNPLDNLSLKVQTEFSDSLHFGENGLCSFRYFDVEEQLTRQSYRNLMNLFSVDVDMALDPKQLSFELGETVTMSELQNKIGNTLQFSFLKGYVCAMKGSCRQDSQYACTNNCISPIATSG